ncbi:unnamed protein product [Durusdinium trenchii]|uniref:Peptidase metallopeptidase domain-containing protein n=2 Tax=Durusdinium trenchii TaxID=1381693 RepID=A0ABP0HH12_9DINO
MRPVWLPALAGLFAAGEQCWPESDGNPLLQVSHRSLNTSFAKQSPRQVGDECTVDSDCASGVCAMTWFGFAGFSSSQGYALRACQAKLQDYRIQLKQKAAGSPKMTKKLRPILNRAKKAWEAVIRGLSLLPGESDGSQIMVLEYAFLSSRQFGRMYCGCNNACCKDAFGSSGPLKFKLADPTQGLRGVVVRAEVVFNIIKLQQYLNTQFLDVLFLREMGVALGIGSMWQFKGIAYEEDPDTRNTLSKLYASSGPATGGLFLPTEGISSHGVYQLTNDWRRFPLPKPVSGPPNFDIGYDKDVMRVTLLRNSWIGPQSVGFLYDLGFTVDYSAAGKFSSFAPTGSLCRGCNARPRLYRPETRVQDRDGTIRVIPGRGFSTLGLDAELKEDAVGAINPAETPCNSNRDCVSGICVTTILGFLQSNGYDLESQSVDGFSPKVCKPKFYDFNIALSTETDAFPQYNFIIEEARQKWQSIIRGIARPLRGNRVPGDLEIKFDFFNENSNTLGSAGPQEVDFYDSIDGSYFLTRRGGMKFNARFLENNLIDLDTFKAVVLHEMGHILLIGLWDLLTTFAECQVESKFTDAYLDGAGNAAMGHYLLSKQWTKAIKTPLRLYRTPSLTAPGSDCGHWDERLLDNELMTPFVSSAASLPLSIITAGGLEDLGYTIDYRKCDIWPDANTDSSLYTFYPKRLENRKSSFAEAKNVARDWFMKPLDVKIIYNEKVITTIPGDRDLKGILKAKKELQEFLQKLHPRNSTRNAHAA